MVRTACGGDSARSPSNLAQNAGPPGPEIPGPRCPALFLQRLPIRSQLLEILGAPTVEKAGRNQFTRLAVVCCVMVASLFLDAVAVTPSHEPIPARQPMHAATDSA